MYEELELVKEPVKVKVKFKSESKNRIMANAAVEYYRHHAASVGRCAQIAGMPEEDFIDYLGSKKLSIFQFESEQDFLEDIDNA